MKHHNLQSRVVAAFAVISMLAASCLFAGPLTPPIGPVNGTGKTLTEVEPRTPISTAHTPGDADSMYRITAPGTYYLTGYIFVNPDHTGIEIAASNVTIDLMGYRILGTFLTTSLHGIAEDTAIQHSNIRITNGSITGCGGHGIFLSDDGDNHHIDNIQCYDNGEFGIRCGDSAIIDSCSAAYNGSTGICTFGSGATIRNCTALSNGGSGIIASSNATITDCISTVNTSVGFRTGNGSTLSNCSARENGFDGFDIGVGNTIDSCSAYNNGAEGIDASAGCTISSCSLSFNHGDGILALGAGTIRNCSVYASTGDGIEVGNDTLLQNNSCDSNGNGGDGAGIHVTGSDNRLQDNHCTDNDRGIDVDVAGNIIIRNTCASNTIDWVIAANNAYGPIIDRRNLVSAAVNGFTAASTLASTDPNANFSH